MPAATADHEPVPLHKLPPEQRVPGNLPLGVSVQVNPEESRTEMKSPTHQGAVGLQAFTRKAAKLDPSIVQANEYAEHLRDHRICFATFVPESERDLGHVFDFKTDGDRTRVINPGESVPIYFSSDVEKLKTVNTVRLSAKPLNKNLLDREFELRTRAYEELVEITRSILGQVAFEKLPVKTKPHLIRACLAQEFGDAEVKRNTESIYR